MPTQRPAHLDNTPTLQAAPLTPMCGQTLHNSTAADGQPLMSTSSGLRLTARRGRLTLKPQADFRDSLSLHCIARHPSVQFAPTRQRSVLATQAASRLGGLTSVSRGIVITAHRLIRPLQAKRAVQSCGQKPLRSLLTRTAAI